MHGQLASGYMVQDMSVFYISTPNVSVGSLRSGSFFVPPFSSGFFSLVYFRWFIFASTSPTKNVPPLLSLDQTPPSIDAACSLSSSNLVRVPSHFSSSAAVRTPPPCLPSLPLSLLSLLLLFPTSPSPLNCAPFLFAGVVMELAPVGCVPLRRHSA